jgi:hypothetical protein
MLHKAENGKTYNIPDKEIDLYVASLGITISDAVDLWLEDNGYQTNEEQEELNATASKVKINLGNGAADKKSRKGAPRTVKVSDEKKDLFQIILENLKENYENVEVLNENKLFSVKINEKSFKINITEDRKPKKA